MPDWQRFIREKLADAAISGIERENLIAELANHLEDLHAELLASGIAEPEASAQCRKQLIDIHQIAAAKRSTLSCPANAHPPRSSPPARARRRRRR